MKVYLVYEECGEWEDYYKTIIKAFFSREKAEELKQQLEKDNKEILDQYEKCELCPYKYGEKDDKCTCDKYKLDEDGYCENYEYIYDDYCYSIKELEVEEQ